MPLRDNAHSRSWRWFFLSSVLLLCVGLSGRSQPPAPVGAGTGEVPQSGVPKGEDEPPTTPDTQSANDGTEREYSGPRQKLDSEKTFWEKVPPIQPYPRQGNFFISPTGTGYYTLLDLIRDRELSDRPKDPYLQWGQNPNPAYNLDFRYIDDPENAQVDFLSSLKRVHFGDNWLFSTGGEVRDRYATIQNAALYDKRPQAGADDTFNLFRTRVYGSLWYLDQFRLFAEFFTAEASTQAIPPSSTDVAKNDFLNLFIDVKLFTHADQGAYLRVGRQELLFGSQRAISPSDWSNVRRTFQGIRGTWRNDKIEEDWFIVNPVIPDTNKISSIDDRQWLAGNWFKYRFALDTSADLYYLYLANHNPGVAKGQYRATGGYNLSTLGTRFVGNAEQFLYDFEATLQLGSWVNQSVLAGIAVAGLGYYLKNIPGQPTFWVYYDYASGDPNPNGSHLHRTYTTLFPFGHAYFAGLDAIGRQNIKDFHLELGIFPTKWVRATLGYHVLTLDQARDALYSPTGSVVRQDSTGRAGTNVGDALSATIQFHLTDHQILLFQYSHLFAGPFIKQTAVTPGAAKDLDAFWIQYSYRW